MLQQNPTLAFGFCSVLNTKYFRSAKERTNEFTASPSQKLTNLVPIRATQTPLLLGPKRRAVGVGEGEGEGMKSLEGTRRTRACMCV